MAFSPDSKTPPPLLRRTRASAMARLVLCGLVLVNLGVFAGSRLASWSSRTAGGGGVEAVSSAKSMPRRALGASSSPKSSTSRLTTLAKLAATDAGPKGMAARRELAHAEPEIWASGGENRSRRDISANVSRCEKEIFRSRLNAGEEGLLARERGFFF